MPESITTLFAATQEREIQRLKDELAEIKVQNDKAILLLALAGSYLLGGTLNAEIEEFVATQLPY